MRSTRDSAERDVPLFELRGLCVDFNLPAGRMRAVDSVSLELRSGQCLAVVGESGSGKSQTFLACLDLLAANGRATGSARFEGRELIGAAEPELNALRGTRIVTVFQDPMNALTPQLTIGEQLSEVLTAHGLASRREAQARALEVLAQVGIPDPRRRIAQYPHEFSGGMRQRAVIAMALMARPKLLIADEPTTALDVTIQAQVLALLRDLRDQGLAIVLITHDLGVAAGIADQLAVMYAGRVVEAGAAAEVLAAPAHPYTRALLAAVPRLDDPTGRQLAWIEGQPPRPGEIEAGCAFEPRCTERRAACRESRPELRRRGTTRAVACHRADEWDAAR
jgi:oligopeptide/dipeptide ABC transporter ATP-binding protein